ncbi:WD40-repeat-containing domain protein [Scheffersomyces xylosifermentans]|uniref:WD40-repeat-containing domain protein n=1 Tax=Scheffersomyces xylosifermentans TaxID=1304137 RepID=UPI00315D9673
MSSRVARSNKNFFGNLTSQQVKDKPLSGHTASSTEIILIAINATGTRLVTSRTDKSIRIWRCTANGLIDPIVIEEAHAKSVESVSWNPKTEHNFATVGKDKFIKIWKGQSGTLERKIVVDKTLGQSDPTSLKIVNYSHDGQILLAVDRDSTLFVYSVSQNYKKIHELKLDENIYDVQWFQKDHSYFVCALHDGSLPVYKIEESEEDSEDDTKVILKTTLTGHRSSATSVKVDPHGSYLAVGSSEGVISIWNTASMLNNKVITEVDESIACIEISRDGTYLAAAYDRGSNILIYDVHFGEKVYEVPDSVSGKLAFSAVTWFPNKTAFAYTSDHGTTLSITKKPETTARNRDAHTR